MKRIAWLVMAYISVIVCSAQEIRITTDRTSSLVFPYEIIHIDRGSKDLLVQQVKEAPAVLLLKAASRHFPATNLSIVTSNGSVYSLSVLYDSMPPAWLYQIPALGQQSVETTAANIEDNPATMHRPHAQSWDVQACLSGIYIKNRVIYYQLYLENQSPIDYGIDFIRFYIRDKRKGRRTATQEIEMKPICVIGNNRGIVAGSANTLVFALNQFTIPDAKYLAIEINERNGGRHLRMKVNNKHILRAIGLPDTK